MTPEEQSNLAEKRWLARAKTVRQAVARAIAGAMGIRESEVAFIDREASKRISDLFASRARTVSAREVPSRADALRFVETHLGSGAGPAFLLPDGYDDSGAVPVEFGAAIDHLGALLASQNEIFRLVSQTGDKGVCVFTQEGPDEDYPRFVQLWGGTDGKESLSSL
jgi:hypothetical protein